MAKARFTNLALPTKAGLQSFFVTGSATDQATGQTFPVTLCVVAPVNPTSTSSAAGWMGFGAVVLAGGFALGALLDKLGLFPSVGSKRD
jgi:hypothetical protein